MASDDVEIGIDGSAAKRGANEVVAQLGRIEKAAGSVSSRAGKKLDTLFTKIQRLSGVQSVSSAKIQSIQNLANAIGVLGATRGPNKAMVANMAALFKALSAFRAPAGLSSLASAINAFSNFKGPSKVSVANLKSLFAALTRLPGTAGLQKMLSDLRLITARLAPVASALTRLQGAGGAAANGLRRAGTAARSTHADFVGLRASSLSLGGALLRTGEFASALGAAFGLRTIATEINTLQKTESGLMAVTGSLAQSRKEMEFLMQTARTYKVYVGDLSIGYSQFRIASEGLGLSLAETQQIFKDVTQGVRVFNLSTDDAEGVFRALTQIASKGSLQMEELRGQLGDRMPVAVQAMANALKVTTAQLADMMKKGLVTGETLRKGLVGFGAEIRRMTDSGLLRSTQTLGASLGDLKTTFYEFANAAGNAGLTEFFQNIASGLNSMMTDGSAANRVFNLMAGSLAFVSRNVSILGVALAALYLPKIIAYFVDLTARMGAFTLAVAANSAATATNQTQQLGLIGKLRILGSATSTSAGLTALHTAATTTNTAATLGAATAQGVFRTALQVTMGAMRALWLLMMAHPLTLLIALVAALAAGFIWLRDATDETRKAQERYKAATDLAAEASMAATSSVEALANKYRDLEAAALAAAAAQARANANSAANQFNEARDAAGRLRPGMGGFAQESEVNAIFHASRRAVSAGGGAEFNRNAGIVLREGGRLLDFYHELESSGTKLTRAQEAAKKYTQAQVANFSTAQTAAESYGRAATEVAAGQAATRASNRGLTGEARIKAINEDADFLATAKRFGVPLNEPASTTATFSDTSGGGGKNKGKSAAERELERQQAQAKRFVSAMDPVYDANDRLAESLQALGYVSDSVFGRDTVQKIELVQRAINDAFREVGKFDVASNLDAEWQDNRRMVESYAKALKAAGLEAEGLVDRADALSRLEYASNYADALGPIGRMADLILTTERQIEQMKAASTNLQLSEADRANIAAEIADQYSRAAREIARSSRQGKLLTQQFENAVASAEDFASILGDAVGSKAVDGLRVQLLSVQRAAEGASSTMRSLSADVGVGMGESGLQSNGDILVTAMRRRTTELHDVGVDAGRMFVNGFNAKLAQSRIDWEKVADERKLGVFRTIADVVSQGGLIGDMQEYADAIDSVRFSMERMGSANPMFAQQKYLLDQLTFAAENMKAAYYAAALESTKLGGVMSRSLDSAGEAILDFVEKGTMDIGSFIRGVQADLLKTFVLNPILNAAKSAIANRMGVADPSGEGNAAGLMQTAANVQNMAAEKLALASQTTQQMQALEQSFQNSLQVRQEANTNQFGLHIATFANAISMMPGAGQALTPYSSPSGATLPLGTTAGDAASGQQGAGQGSIAGAVNATLQQPSQMLGQSAQMLTNAAGQTISGALGLTGVAGQFAGMVIPQMISAVVSQIFGASATSGAAVATGAAATATGGAAAMLITAATMLMTAATIQMTTAMIPGFHSGGIAGGTPTFTRPMSASAFAGAPRYHVGGIAGFKPGELPAVLKRKEEILTEDNPRHIANFYSERGVGPSGGTEVHQNSFSETNTYNIRIEGSGGTPEQNSDLAQKLGDVINKTIDNRTRRTMDKRSRAGGMKVK